MTSQAVEQEKDVNIGAPEGKAKDAVLLSRALVYFDSECPLCKSLASFMAARVDPEVMVFAANPIRGSSALVVEIQFKSSAPKILVGSEAWAWILNSHPSLQEFNWLAQKLGIARGTATSMMVAGSLLRRLCVRCKRHRS